MAHFLVKSEPYKYAFADLVRDRKTVWDGVRNFEARNNLRAMKKGDLVLYYHSNEGKEIVGVAKVARTATTGVAPNTISGRKQGIGSAGSASPVRYNVLSSASGFCASDASMPL